MRDLEHLYRERLQNAYVRGTQTVTLIFKNVMILFLIVLALAYLSAQYSNLMRSHTPYPYAQIVAVLLSLLLTKSSVRTLLKEPDLVFLLPAEPRMNRYFREALKYSMSLQTVLLLILLIFVYPLYGSKLGTTVEFLGSAVLVLLLKMWNVSSVWLETLAGRQQEFRKLLRLGANLCLMLSLFTKHWLLLLLSFLWVAVIWLINRPTGKRHTYPWQRLLELEEKRLSTYYTLANFFVDIPKIKNRVRRRAWAIALINKLPINRQHPYFYLFARTFIRHSEYSGIYFRLFVTAAVMMPFISNFWVALAVYLLAMYLVGFQLPQLGSELRYPELIRIYPLTPKQKEQGFSWLAFCLLTTQAVVSVLPLLVGRLPMYNAGIFLVIGLLMSFWMSFSYLPKRFMRLSTPSEDENEKNGSKSARVDKPQEK